jgi:DNA-binding CsgD family transcriptional regulator
VEFHLSGAFRKLGIGSRRELTSVLAGHAEARSSATNLG